MRAVSLGIDGRSCGQNSPRDDPENGRPRTSGNRSQSNGGDREDSTAENTGQSNRENCGHNPSPDSTESGGQSCGQDSGGNNHPCRLAGNPASDHASNLVNRSGNGSGDYLGGGGLNWLLRA